MEKDFFRFRRIAIATMHHKEKVIGPLLHQFLGMQPMVAPIDTDVFGTFSGERERKQTALETARKKCLMAMQLTGCDLAIASEGSFGAHPTIFFAPADDEWVLLVDRKNNLEITGRALTTTTNFNSSEITSHDDAIEFARAAGFPSHALILKDRKFDWKEIYKGIQSPEEFEAHSTRLLNKHGFFWLETDMRAMYNPTRMKTIEQATHQLIEKVRSRCPQCGFPGYWIVDTIRGLPCSACALPTQSIAAYVYGCLRCLHAETKPQANKQEDPMYCDFCNP